MREMDLLWIKRSNLINVQVRLDHRRRSENEHSALFAYDANAESAVRLGFEFESVSVIRIWSYSMRGRSLDKRREQTSCTYSDDISELNSDKCAIRDELNSCMHCSSRG